MIKKGIFAASLLFLAIGCKKNDTTVVGFTPTCSGTQSYLVDVNPLLQTYCVGCHSQYSSYTKVKSDVSAIRSYIVNGSMPKGTSLTSDQKNKIVCWIDAGAPNN